MEARLAARRGGGRGWPLLIASAALGLCLLAGLACVGLQPGPGAWPMGFGHVMTVCGVAQLRPKVKLGVTWVSPFVSSALPPFHQPSTLCWTMRWLPVLPQRGQMLIPP